MDRTVPLYLAAAFLPAAAHGADVKPMLPYALAKTRVAAAVSQRITRCPPPLVDQVAKGGDYDLGFDYTVLVEGRSVPSRLVTIDPSSGFLVDRATKMTFNEDGLTLKEYNATATGQGGPVIVALVKAAAAVYGLTANPLALAAVVPPTSPNYGYVPSNGARPRPVDVTRYYLVCRDAVAKRLARLEVVSDQIGSLEAQASAAPLGPERTDLLARRRAEQGVLRSALTISTSGEAVIEPSLTATGPGGTMATLLKPADFGEWFVVERRSRRIDANRVKSPAELRSDDPFTVASRLASLPAMIRMPDGSDSRGPMAGLFGYEVRTTLDPKTLAWFSCGPGTETPACGSDDPGEGSIPNQRGLVYRRPVGGTVSLAPLDQPCAKAGSCVAVYPEGVGRPVWLGRERASKKGSVRFPQLSRLFVLPTGGSVFGSRTVGATFDAAGGPTLLQYDKGGGAKDVAGVIDASVGAAQSVDGARLAATKARIDELESAQKLHDLLQPDLDGEK